MQLRDIRGGTDHELVIECTDASVGYHGFIAIHNTRFGPAVGGTRVMAYASREDALADVLRLSSAMSFKAAMAGVPFGGGKAVIVGDIEPRDRRSVFRAHGRFIDQLSGAFITGEDVGTTLEDMALIRTETAHVAVSADPAPWTARGVMHAMRAALVHATGTDDMRGRSVLLQGCGNVGMRLTCELRERGASVLASDLRRERAEAAKDEFGTTTVEPSEMVGTVADIFAPCALGGVLDRETVARLRVRMVVGAANNQLWSMAEAEALRARGILHVPDYVANAGGIINGARELCGWTESRCAAAIERIYETTKALLSRADEHGIAPAAAADCMAREMLHG